MPEKIADSLKSIRARSGLSLAQLADKAGLRPQEIWRMENGQRVPKVAALIALADALNVTLDKLTGRRPRRRRKQVA